MRHTFFVYAIFAADAYALMRRDFLRYARATSAATPPCHALLYERYAPATPCQMPLPLSYYCYAAMYTLRVAATLYAAIATPP